jgi:hypothetical protein
MMATINIEYKICPSSTDKNNKTMNLTNLFLILFSLLINNENTIEKGEILFQQYCNQCHQNGTTILFPEKNLKKENLERNGINSIEAISYQLKNGKVEMIEKHRIIN